MLLSHLFLPRENYTTISLTPIFRAGTPVEQCAHTVSNEIFTPVGRNLQAFLLYPIYGGVLMRSKRIPVEEQYRLIMECRQSGIDRSSMVCGTRH